jgi:hypothetical protein
MYECVVCAEECWPMLCCHLVKTICMPSGGRSLSQPKDRLISAEVKAAFRKTYGMFVSQSCLANLGFDNKCRVCID